MSNLATYGGVPGISSIKQTSEKVVWWGREERQIDVSELLLDSTAVDAGNTPTTELRAGLLLGKKTSDGNLYQWDGDATDGTEVVHGVLLRDISMLDVDGVAEDKYAHILLAGCVKAADLLIQGTLLSSHVDEHMARRQMVASGRFIFDDDYSPGGVFLGGAKKNKTVAADTTVTAADNGTRFVGITGNINFTLPTLEYGLVYEFLRASNHSLTVTSAAGDDMIVGNSLTANAVAFATNNQQIGAVIRVEAVYVSTTLKWLVTLPQPPFGTGLTGGLTIGITA